ncbi:hypothetical protein ACFYYH_20325 [Streptomyces sp. NPDC002018]|uniref:hypothetical protein n=1 Tax=Streptomyces sp. NPDC002018 TaxID=3364629 RepID=UPI003692EEA9
MPAPGGGRGRRTLRIHPDAPAALGPEDGGSVRITVDGATLEAPVEIMDTAVGSGIVSRPHGRGHDRPAGPPP